MVSAGQQVVSDYTHKIVVKEDGTQSLIVVPAVPQDSGEWTVIAQNRAGRSSISVTLAVEGLTAARQKMLVDRQVPKSTCALFFSQRNTGSPSVCGEAEKHHGEAGDSGGTSCQSHRKPPP